MPDLGLAVTVEELRGDLRREDEGIALEEEAAQLSLSLARFIREGWHVVEPAVPYVHNWHIDAIVEHLEAVSTGDIKNLQVWVPPGSMKSRAVSVFWPAWEWTSKPWLRYWTASYDLDLSSDLAVASRDLIRSDWFQMRWGTVFKFKSDANLKRSYANDKGGARLATAPTARGSGRHGERILVDDPVNAKDADATSRRVIDSVNAWWDGTVQTRGVGDFARVIIMQRLHENDLAAHALKNADWTVLCLPETYEAAHPFVWPDDPRQEGELLWPERFDETRHKERLGMGMHRAAGQLQQRPAAREGETLKRADWRYYDPALADVAKADVGKLPKFNRIVLSWDTAFKEKTTSDFVAGGVWGRHGGDTYLLRLFHARAGLNATKQAMLDQRAWALDRWPGVPVHLLIEKSANGVEIIDQLKREVPGVQPVVASVDKTLRAEAAAPDLESHNVFIPGRANGEMTDYDPSVTPAWAQQQVEECATFPNGTHDDLVDQFTQAINWLRTRGLGRASVSSPSSHRIPAPAGIPSR